MAEEDKTRVKIGHPRVGANTERAGRRAGGFAGVSLGFVFSFNTFTRTKALHRAAAWRACVHATTLDVHQQQGGRPHLP
jgi:hypothetical protein